MITMEEALELQSRLQAETYGKPLEELTGEEFKDAMRTHTLALLDEVHEVLRETSWKPWKRGDGTDFNAKAAREEMVDAFHFFMNVMLLLGIDWDDLLLGYEEKRAENVARQKRGY